MSSEEPPAFAAVGLVRDTSDRRDAPALLAIVREVMERERASHPTAFAQVFDAAAVAGKVHLESAVARAARARARGRPRLSDAGAEVALFLAGTDQLPEALRRVGVGPDSRSVVLLLSPPRAAAELVSRLGMREDGSVYPRPATRATLLRLGLDAADLDSVGPERWEALAVEGGARVELSRAASARRKG